MNKIINYITHNIISFFMNKFIKHSNKFISILHTNEYEVLTNNGYKDFKGIGLTKKFKIYKIKTENGCELKCADDHIVIDNKGNEILTKNLKIGTILNTTFGFSKVTCIKKFNKYDNMYDLMDVDGSLYYTNNILSHNTTIVTVYACWKFLFRSYNTTAIIGNKKSTAVEVLERVQIGYESLPRFLQQPIVTYNKGDMKGKNGSKIFTSATTRDSISGKSVNDLIIDECIGKESLLTVKNNETGKIEQITIGVLYDRM